MKIAFVGSFAVRLAQSVATQPFHTLGNLTMTPHVSGWTEGMLSARARLIADNFARIARGETPLDAVKTIA